MREKGRKKSAFSPHTSLALSTCGFVALQAGGAIQTILLLCEIFVSMDFSHLLVIYVLWY